ncbi:MAG: hypothetical protein LBT55_04525 [Clostridiaceae bacterium]|jgi:hypothetical protein|nr:hypothetical protein [Clostridiaceae bacterium]
MKRFSEKILFIAVTLIALTALAACAKTETSPAKLSVSGRVVVCVGEEAELENAAAEGTADEVIAGAEILLNGLSYIAMPYTAEDGGFSLTGLSAGDIITFSHNDFDIPFISVTTSTSGLEICGVKKAVVPPKGYILKINVSGGTVLVNGEVI